MPVSHTSQAASLRFTSRRGHFSLLTIAIIAMAAGACQSSNQEKADSSAALDTTAIRASIDSLGAKVMRANETGDVELYAATWAADGILSYPGNPPVHGRDSIVARFRRRPPLPPGAKMTIHPTELQIQSAEWAYVMGVDTLRFTPPNGSAPVQETSTFLVILRKGSEGWQTYREVLSANQ
jgi:ketosteroid isomerase-like protein